jgi:hypothetical protein
VNAGRPWSTYTPPPCPLAQLLANVQLATAGLARKMYMAPPKPFAPLVASALPPVMAKPSRMTENGMHLFEVTLVWLDWLTVAVRLQDLKKYMGQLRSLMDNALRPYGWTVRSRLRRLLRCSIEPLDGLRQPLATIRVAKAVEELRKAEKSLLEKDFTSAAHLAAAALEHCHESRLARMIIGMCVFRHGVKLDEALVDETADYLADYEERLQKNARRLMKMWQEESRRREYWQEPVMEYVKRYNSILEEYADGFLAARKWLQSRNG